MKVADYKRKQERWNEREGESEGERRMQIFYKLIKMFRSICIFPLRITAEDTL